MILIYSDNSINKDIATSCTADNGMILGMILGMSVFFAKDLPGHIGKWAPEMMCLGCLGCLGFFCEGAEYESTRLPKN